MDILDAIDAAVGCQHCGGPLGGSPSDDFCSPQHQADWHAERADELVGYREPWSRPDEFPGIGSQVHDSSGSCSDFAPSLRFYPSSGGAYRRITVHWDPDDWTLLSTAESDGVTQS